ncbi:unnamed protein product [Phaedon cochleariae]|uniref:Methyltransferase type 12 domain-containing protein n=1 Tax=Phaedon cochleariae TaxID=80249 RepID=A0A9P0DFP4_PHACE|nr:unnamed protein product [Phaedon cochleariae]
MNNPELYAETNGLAGVSAKFVIDKYGKWLTWKDSESIMEFGIGTGNTTKEIILPRIPQNFAEYVATDISKAFVNAAKSTLGQQTRFHFKDFDIESEKVPSDFIERFNHIMSFIAMHWINTPRKAFENMLEMLKSDGEIFLMYFDKSPIDGALEQLAKIPRWAEYGHENFISPYYYSNDPLIACEEDMTAAGIENYKIRIEKMVYRFPSVDDCINGLYSVSPVLNRIPKEELEDYKRDYVKYALRTGGYFEGNDEFGCSFIGINYNLIVAYAKK